MSEDALSANLRTFITDNIDSVMAVEVLTLLHASSDRYWTALELAKELRIDPAFAEPELANLSSRGILSRSDAGQYRYAPRSPEVDRAVAELVRAYADRRVTIISLIFSKPVDKIRSFADAFRLRKEKD